MTEAEFQDRIIHYAMLKGWRVNHVQSVTMKAKGGRLLNVTPAAKGFPDLELVRGGFIYHFEVKSEKGYASDEQIDWLNELAGVSELGWRSRGSVPDHVTGPSGIVALVRPRHWAWIEEVLR